MEFNKLTKRILGLCRKISAGKSCNKTSRKNSQECNRDDGWGGLISEFSTEFKTCLSASIRGCHSKLWFGKWLDSGTKLLSWILYVDESSKGVWKLKKLWKLFFKQFFYYFQSTCSIFIFSIFCTFTINWPIYLVHSIIFTLFQLDTYNFKLLLHILCCFVRNLYIL